MRFQSPWGLLHAGLVGKALDSQRAEEVISFYWDILEHKGVQDEGTFPYSIVGGVAQKGLKNDLGLICFLSFLPSFFLFFF